MTSNINLGEFTMPPEKLPAAYLSLLIDIDAHVTTNQMALCAILAILRGQAQNSLTILEDYQKFSTGFAEELRATVLAKWGE